MRSFVVFSASVLLLILLVVPVQGTTRTEREYQRAYTAYIKQYNKHYTTSTFHTHYTTFKTNLDIISAHNQITTRTFDMGINAFTDIDTAEFIKTYNGWRPTKTDLDDSERVKVELPASVPAALDWRKKNVVTGVKDQGQCGSCWSFSATGSMEGAVALAGNNLTSLSEQQLMDCDTLSDSCEGGSMTSAFLFAILNSGMCSEAAYPYKAVDQSPCQSCTVVSKIKSAATVFYNAFEPTDESYLLAALQLGPVSVAVEADQDSWQKYTSGVITSDVCGTTLDHGVLLVGYDHDNKTGLDYWIVKNSWNVNWGLDGYVWLARGQNTCGINQQASYPIA